MLIPQCVYVVHFSCFISPADAFVANDHSSVSGMAPSGKYLRTFHKGEWDKKPKRYEEIFAFAERHNLMLHGFSREMGINENVIGQIEDYIVQIEIPVPG